LPVEYFCILLHNNSVTLKVAIAGASGYAGGELLRLLVAHPEVEIGALTASASAGTRLGHHHPHLTPLADRILLNTTAQTLANHDVVFLALPHGRSAEIAAGLSNDALVVDLGADHRLVSPEDWHQWYGGEHAGAWTYGLPELPGAREELRAAKRIAVPGCFPTAGTLALIPALAAGLIKHEVVIVSATGSSGAGKSLTPRLLASEVMGSASAYGVAGEHRHTPEFIQNFSKVAGVPVAVSFTPILVPMARGILTTASAPLSSDVDTESVFSLYEQYLRDEPFVHLLSPGQWPATAAVTGSNAVHLQLAVDHQTRRLIVVSALDNLTKVTAGGAIQAMNLALGFNESAGLSTVGIAP
jgi:N-acetyl-gamma-glutamyl-phosphate reductase